MRFMLGVIYVLGNFLDYSSIFLNIGVWEILKKRPYEIIVYAMEIVGQVSLEVINFLQQMGPIQRHWSRLGQFYNVLCDYVRKLSDNMGWLDTNRNSLQLYGERTYRACSIHEVCFTFFSLMKDTEFLLLIKWDTPKVICSLLEKPVTVYEDNQGTIALAVSP